MTSPIPAHGFRGGLIGDAKQAPIRHSRHRGPLRSLPISMPIPAGGQAANERGHRMPKRRNYGPWIYIKDRRPPEMEGVIFLCIYKNGNTVLAVGYRNGRKYEIEWTS